MAPSAIESLDEPDLLARQFTWLSGAATALLISAGAVLLFQQTWIPGLVVLSAAIPAYLLTKRLSLGIPTTVRLDEAGIHRRGRYAWSIPWADLEYAGIHPYESAQMLVAVPRERVRHWSRGLRMKDQILTSDLGPLPEGGYVVPIFEELAWDIEHYIAGHLPGHPGFDPGRLHLPARLMRSQYDDDVPAPGGGRTSRPGSVASRVADPLPRRQSLLSFAFAGFAAVLAVLAWFSLESVAGAVALGIAAAFLVFRGISARSARDAVVLVSEDGITRAGTWGWQHTWTQIASAKVQEFSGQHYLVVVRSDENAPYHRSATSLPGHPFPGNALITPVAADNTQELSAAIRAFKKKRKK
ncbi:MAG: hypothetical protein Q4G64_03705 [bacterium]|nr:hypothetical protein [bacterium]